MAAVTLNTVRLGVSADVPMPALPPAFPKQSSGFKKEGKTVSLFLNMSVSVQGMGHKSNHFF